MKLPWHSLMEQGQRLDMYINGEWKQAYSSKVDSVEDPSLKKVIGYVPSASTDEANEAIEGASKAFSEWSSKSGRQRSKYLFKLSNLLRENLLPLASLLTVESGKSLEEAKAEIRSAIAYVNWYMEEGQRVYGTVIPPADPNKRIFVLQRPLGVITAIAPFNFPFGIFTRKLAATVASGCTFVGKPAPETPLTALILARFVEQSSFPPGVINIITGDGPSIGKVFCEHPAVRKIAFTGSTAVGRILAAQAGAKLKQTHLELGGNSPCIIFPDADLNRAVQSLIYAKFRNAGQVCGSPNRIYVHESIAEKFVTLYAKEINKLVIGPGHLPDVKIGPLINQQAVNKVKRLIEDAVSNGAKSQECGTLAKGVTLEQGYYQMPTILTNVQEKMAICQEEAFGPIATILTFDEESEVVARAKNTNYGLFAFVYTQDLSRALRLSEQLESGNVGINGAVSANIESPFGGIKDSGWGREGGREGLTDFLETITVSIDL